MEWDAQETPFYEVWRGRITIEWGNESGGAWPKVSVWTARYNERSSKDCHSGWPPGLRRNDSAEEVGTSRGTGVL